MTPDTDVLILGGGCAGLSLAVALAERAPAMRVDTLEARMDYTRDRTWC
jgi:lycopene beta-cyclase